MMLLGGIEARPEGRSRLPFGGLGLGFEPCFGSDSETLEDFLEWRLGCELDLLGLDFELGLDPWFGSGSKMYEDSLVWGLALELGLEL